MILIVGATGYLGNATARRLLAAGESVRAMTRTPANALDLQELDAEVIAGNFAFDPTETLKQYPMELTRLEPWVQEKVAEPFSPQVRFAA